MLYFETVRITVLAERLFRVERDERRQFTDEATQTVLRRDFSPVAFSVRRGGDWCEVRTASATLHVGSDPGKDHVCLNGKRVPLDGKHNLGGTYRTLDFCDGDIYVPENRKIVLGNGVCSRSGVALLDDVHSLVLRDDGTICHRRRQESDLYVFAFGDDYRGAVKALYEISGYAPMLPRFALGNWWSRYYPYTQTEYLDMLDRFAADRIPFSVAVVDMDWHYSNHIEQELGLTVSYDPADYTGGLYGWTGYTWNKNLFPDHRAFLRAVRERGLAVSLNVHPKDGVRFFEEPYEAMCKAMHKEAVPGGSVEFDFTDNAFIRAYFSVLHHPAEREGVSFWWIDWQQGTHTALAGLDPLWALNHYHYLDNAASHRNGLILSRYAGIGSHRYPVGFSGDSVISWRSLAYLPYFTATASNAGFGWWSHDIGMHMLGCKDAELYVRSIQFGVFSPINRMHSTAFPTLTKEPRYYMNGAGDIAARYLRLRHRMIPFLYSAAHRTHTQGRMLIEPMYYAWPRQKEAYACRGQYLFGGQLLVAPITSRAIAKGIAKKRVWLPPGKWTDVFTGESYAGGRWTDLYRWLDDMPVLAGEGGLFVLAEDWQEGSGLPRSVEVNVFNGVGEYTLFEEDENGASVCTHIRNHGSGGVQTVEISVTGNAASLPAERSFLLRFRNIVDKNCTVTVNGSSVAVRVDGCACVRVDENGTAPIEICVRFAERTPLQERKDRALDSLTRFDGDTLQIFRCYERLNACTTEEEFVSAVQSFALPSIYRKKLLEF